MRNLYRLLGMGLCAWACCTNGAALAKAQFVIFAVAGANATYPTAINASGVVAGYYATADKSVCPGNCGFVRQTDGSIDTFTYGSGQDAIPYGINASGTVVGGSTSDGFMRTSGGTITTLSVPGAIATAGDAIADDGTIAGDYQTSDHITHSFLRKPDGTVRTFDPVGAIFSQPKGIDNAREIVGSFADSAGVFHGYVRRTNGTIATFDVPGAGTGLGQGTSPAAIDDAGTIVGSFIDSAGHGQSFWRTAGGAITAFAPDGTTPSGAVAVAPTGERSLIAGRIYGGSGSLSYLRMGNGAVQIFKPAFNEVDGMNASGVIVGVYQPKPTSIPRGFLRIP
jgi:hypothetical protein